MTTITAVNSNQTVKRMTTASWQTTQAVKMYVSKQSIGMPVGLVKAPATGGVTEARDMYVRAPNYRGRAK